MTGLDTNILARFFLQDDPVQSPKTVKLFASLSQSEPGWIAVATVLELVWVLSSQKRMDRRGICKVLELLFSRNEIVIEQPEIMQSALRLFQNGSADFADCLIAASARAAGCSRTVTFDRKAALATGMQLLE